MIIGITTPSYRRLHILQKFLDRMPRQTYGDWRLIVVHDGPNPDAEALVGRAAARDPRITYAETAAKTNDVGVSPRAVGARYMCREVRADYCVFWDDDCHFSRRALRRIVDAIAAAGRPDLLLVPYRKDGEILPTPGARVDQLTWGQVDTACLVARPEVALEGYEYMRDAFRDQPPAFHYPSDYRFFQHVRDEVPGLTIRAAACRPIGLHDGLWTSVRLRSFLRLAPLGIVGRYRGWLRGAMDRRTAGEQRACI